MKQKNPRDTCDTLEIILHVSRVSHVSIALIFLSHTDYADFTEGTCSARAAVRGNAECVWLKDSGGVNSFEELRPERPKAHSPGQGEQREPTPWVCSTPTTWRPERAKALNHKTVCWIITYFCRAFALSGRNLCVGHLSQGVAPCSRLPWAGRYCPFRARNDSALFYLLMGTFRNVHLSQGEENRRLGGGM